jgi:hypothetical protein
MPYLGAFIILYRSDPAMPDRGLPPFFIIERTPGCEGERHPIDFYVRTSLYEQDPDWETHLYNQACATAVLNSIDPRTLCRQDQAEIATVNYNVQTGHFIIEADCPFFDRPGMLVRVMEAFELPNDRRFVEVVVGPEPYSRADELPQPLPFVYDWDEDQVLEHPHTRVYFAPPEGPIPEWLNQAGNCASSQVTRSIVPH